MANFSSYLCRCLLLLLSLNLRSSSGAVLRIGSAEQCARCAHTFDKLLHSLTEILKSDLLCFGIPSDAVTVDRRSETVDACAPATAQNSSCFLQRRSSFSESACWMNIVKDMDHYDAAIQSYLLSTVRSHKEEDDLLSPTQGIIQGLRENCPMIPKTESKSPKEDTAQMWGDDSFDNRLKMCKMMRGFHVRAITINRAIGYMSSGDHRK